MRARLAKKIVNASPLYKWYCNLFGKKPCKNKYLKTIIAKMTCVFLTAPLIPIMLIGIIPYALFKGITSERVWDEYFDIWNSFTNFLIHPYYKYMERKNYIKKLKQKVDYYREENVRLNNALEKIEKEK